MSVLKSVRSRKFLAALSALAAVAAMLLGANVASGDEVWNQSYQRASQSEECVAQPGETPWQTSWGTDSSWKPSWAKWANEGQGGWVCDRSITWARTPVAAGSSSTVTYALGDIGPGGGLVFLISGGLTYEMARKDWGVGSAIDPAKAWTTTAPFCYASGSDTANANCETDNLYPGTSSAQSASTTASEAIGMGSVNTADIKARMVAGGELSSAYAAGLASAYAGVDGLTTGWFLPSKDELNAMCYYSRNLSASPDPTVNCYGSAGTTQDGTFAAGTYGFDSFYYWSSSQYGAIDAWAQGLGGGGQATGGKFNALRVRPVRAF